MNIIFKQYFSWIWAIAPLGIPLIGKEKYRSDKSYILLHSGTKPISGNRYLRFDSINYNIRSLYLKYCLNIIFTNNVVPKKLGSDFVVSGYNVMLSHLFYLAIN